MTNSRGTKIDVPPLPRSTVWVHGSLGLPLAVVGYPIAIWVIPHYTGTLGVSLAAVGTMLMLARISDVVTDPLIGFASDHLRTRFGRRKPWILVGMPLMMIGIWMLFVPAPGIGVLYLLWWLFVMMLGSTLISLPYGAWGAELSMDYHQRPRVTAAREIFALGGLLLAALVPFMVEYFGDRTTLPLRAGPTSRGNTHETPCSATSPRRENAVVNLASSAAKRMSAIMACTNPRPAHAPLMVAITGLGIEVA